MSLFEIALIVCAVFVTYNLQQIKIALKLNGYPVEMFSGWLRDHRQFKELIEAEKDQKRKVKYKQTLNGLHFSLFGIVLFTFLVIQNRMA